MALPVQFSDRGYRIEKSYPTVHELKIVAAEASNNCRFESEYPTHLAQRGRLLPFHFFEHHVAARVAQAGRMDTPSNTHSASV